MIINNLLSSKGVNPSFGLVQTKKKKLGFIHSKLLSKYVKGKAFPLQACTGPWGSRRLRLQNF